MAYRIAYGEEHGSPATKKHCACKSGGLHRELEIAGTRLLRKKGTTPSEQTSSTRCNGNPSPATLEYGLQVKTAAWTCPPMDFAKMPYLPKKATGKFAGNLPQAI